MTEEMDYWRKLVSTSSRYLQEYNNLDAVKVIKHSEFKVEYNCHDNWNGGIDFWNLVFYLKYEDFTAINDLKHVEKEIFDVINIFHKDDYNLVSNVMIRPIVEQFIDWGDIYPVTKEQTIQLIKEEKELLTKVATGELQFKKEGVEEEFQKRHCIIMDLAVKAGFKYPVQESSLSAWWVRVKRIKTYAERRLFIDGIFDNLLKQLNKTYGNESDINFHNISSRSITISKAIDDADLFIREGKMDSAVDRIHTALHGYLIELLAKFKDEFDKEESLPTLFKNLYTRYKSVILPESIGNRIQTVLRSGSGIINTINELRNNNTIVHPNEQLIQKREAQLVLRLTNALVDYIEDVNAQFEKRIEMSD